MVEKQRNPLSPRTAIYFNMHLTKWNKLSKCRICEYVTDIIQYFAQRADSNIQPVFSVKEYFMTCLFCFVMHYLSVSLALKNMYFLFKSYIYLWQRTKRGLSWSWRIMSTCKNIIERLFIKKIHIFCNDVSDSARKASRWLHFKSYVGV